MNDLWCEICQCCLYNSTSKAQGIFANLVLLQTLGGPKYMQNSLVV